MSKRVYLFFISVFFPFLTKFSHWYGSNDDDVSDDELRARYHCTVICYLGDEVMIILLMKVAQSTRAAFCHCTKVYSLGLLVMVAM